MLRQFGGRITRELREQYEASPQWQNGKFQNIEETQLAVNIKQMPGIILKSLRGRSDGEPQRPLPIIPFDKKAFLADSHDLKLVWYGHSAILLRLDDKTILIDPMLGPDASPIGPKRTRRFSRDTLDLIDALPEIDLLLMSHDHYDHLDLKSILKLKEKTKQYFVGLGLKRHLVAWGVDPALVVEFDWWDQHTLDSTSVMYTPTRHFSGRGLTSMARCLWGGWYFLGKTQSVWFSGDGGYGRHFKEIARRIGPVDLAMMECGQYNHDWHAVHMFPHEAIRAAQELGVRIAMPVHWAAFNLSYQHSWYEPAEEFLKSAMEVQQQTITPKLGAIVGLNDHTIKLHQEPWWEAMK